MVARVVPESSWTRNGVAGLMLTVSARDELFPAPLAVKVSVPAPSEFLTFTLKKTVFSC